MAEGNQFQPYPELVPTLERLSGAGQGILAGNLPDYYKPVGEYGGAEFENLMKGVQRDIGTGVREDMAKRGVGRGGPTATAKATADASNKLRFADYERAMGTRGNLLGMGLETEFGAAKGYTDLTGMKSRHELTLEDIAARAASSSGETGAAYASAQAGLWSDVVGGLGSIGGTVLGGWLGGTTSSAKKITGCFACDTEVETSEGRKFIKDIEVNDIIKSRDGFTKVVKTLEYKPEELVVVNGVSVTKHHPFVTESGLKLVGDLREGDKLISGEAVVVGGKPALTDKIYNLETESHHFVVGNNILVHDGRE